MTKILIVDDSATERLVLSHMLDSLSHMSIKAVDGKEGLDLLIRESPDLVILDYNMPHVNGYDFSRAVRTDEAYAQLKDIPIVGNGDFPDDKLGFLDECFEKGHLRNPTNLKVVITWQMNRYNRLHDSRDTYVNLVVQSLVRYGVTPCIFPAMSTTDQQERITIAVSIVGLPQLKQYELARLTPRISDAMQHRF